MFEKRIKDLVIDQEKCVGCKRCIGICFMDVIRYDEESRKCQPLYPGDCEACMCCEAMCPSEAIDVIPRFPVHVADPFR